MTMYCHFRLEIENARLEAAAKQQSHRIDALQKGAKEAAMVSAGKLIQELVHTGSHHTCYFISEKKSYNI